MSVLVTAGQSIAASIRNNPGAVLQLEAGATFIESVQLTDRGGAIVGGVGTKLGSPAGQVILGHGAKNWTIGDLELLPTKDGIGNVVELSEAVGISFQQLTFTGGDKGQRRVILGNGRDIRVEFCAFRNVWRVGEESNAFCAYSGAGPYTLVDNEFEVAGINILFGGSNSASPEHIPADLTVARNRLTKNPAWKGTAVVVKNLLELKQAKRAVVEDNWLEHNWGGQGQSGYGVLFTAVNDDGGAPWACVEDVLFQRNTLRNSERGIQISGHDPYAASGQVTRVRILDNDLGAPSWLFSIGNLAGEIEVGRNRASNTGFKAFFYAGATRASGSWVNWSYAVELLRWYDNDVQGEFRGDSADSKWEPFVKEFIAVAPMPVPEPEPQPEPEPEPEPDPLAEITSQIAELQAENAALKDALGKVTAGQDLMIAKVAELEAKLVQALEYLAKIPVRGNK